MSSLSGYKANRLSSCLESKLGICFRDGSELSGWYILDNKKRLFIRIPHGHSKEIGKGTVNKIIGQLRVDKEEFHNLYHCPMSGTDYEQKVRDLISNDKL